MRDFIVMVGVPGSGKSTMASELVNIYKNSHSKYDDFGRNDILDVISSDEIRERILNDVNDQTQNELVFKEVHNMIKKSLYDHHHIVVDATNINIKARKGILECLNCLVEKDRKHYNVIAYVMPTPEKICKERNSSRDRVVPEFVIDKQICKFEMPFFEEGFDKIYIHGWEKYFNKEYMLHDLQVKSATEESINTIVDLMKGFDQKTKHHKYDLGTHCIKTAEEIKKRTSSEVLYRTALIHDIGKLDTGRPKEDGSGDYCYYSHHNVGAYKLLTNIDMIAFDNWEDTIDLLFYVNFHMQPFFIESEKAKNKWKRIFGEEKFNNLILFNECDKIATGREE